MVRINRAAAASIVIAFVLIDILASSLLFIRNDRIEYRDGGDGNPHIRFDVRTSQIDHCGLALIRAALLVGALIGISYNWRKGVARANAWSIYAVCLCLAMLVYSPFKLLALAEATSDFGLPWFWLLFAWNVLASTGCAAIWLFVLAKVQPKIAVDNNRRRTAGGGGESSAKEDGVAGEGGGAKEERLIEHKLIYGVRNEMGFEAVQVDDDEVAEEEKKKAAEAAAKSLKQVKEQVVRTGSTMWRLIKYCKHEWLWYLIGFVFLIFYSTARIFIPKLTGQVISDIVVYKSYDRLRHSVTIMALLAVASSICAAFRSGAFQYAIAKMSTRSRKDLFSSLVRQEIGFYDTTKTGDITSRLAADCQAMSDTISSNVNVFLRSSIMLVGTLVFMFHLCWQMTVMTFIAIPLIAVVSKGYGMYYERLAKEAQDSLAKASEVSEEVLSSMRTVRSFANESGESERYNSKMTEVLRVKTRQTYAFIGFTWINEFVDIILLIAVLWYGGHLVLTGKLRSEDLIAYLLYQLQLGEALINIGWVFTGLMQAVGASAKVFEWIDRKPEIPNDGIMKTEAISGAIEFKDVSFAYPSRPDVDVLKGVSFDAKPGEIVALVGPSGGGKSSCIALMEHFYEPKSGVVTLDGVPVERYDHRHFHNMVSLVGQEPVLFARSIADNIAYGLEMEEFNRDDILYASNLANAHRFVGALPKTYETDVGEKGVQLSGGQKQRIAIARALIRKPKVLLLDEATSALDAESEYLVQQAIHQNLSGHTVILIAHRLSTVEKADKIIVIDGGRVVQQGSHQQLLAVEGIYRNLVQRQLIGDQTMPKAAAIEDGLKKSRRTVSVSSEQASSGRFSP